MIRTLTAAISLSIAVVACSPPQSDSKIDSTASTTTTPDATKLLSQRTSAPSPQDTISNYVITNQPDYISNPFEFSLDSLSLVNLLGPEVEIESVTTPAGEDELGPYPSFTHYDVSYTDSTGTSKLAFYDYGGKHFGDISTPKLVCRNGIAVGMDKSAFLAAMDLSGNSMAQLASTYTLNDDYGFMSFYFGDDGKLFGIYVSYEEGD